MSYISEPGDSMDYYMLDMNCDDETRMLKPAAIVTLNGFPRLKLAVKHVKPK